LDLADLEMSISSSIVPHAMALDSMEEELPAQDAKLKELSEPLDPVKRMMFTSKALAPPVTEPATLPLE